MQCDTMALGLVLGFAFGCLAMMGIVRYAWYHDRERFIKMMDECKARWFDAGGVR